MLDLSLKYLLNMVYIKKIEYVRHRIAEFNMLHDQNASVYLELESFFSFILSCRVMLHIFKLHI